MDGLDHETPRALRERLTREAVEHHAAIETLEVLAILRATEPSPDWWLYAVVIPGGKL